MHDRSISGLPHSRFEPPRLESRGRSGRAPTTLRRLSLICASLLIGASLWFLLDDSDQLGAQESGPASSRGVASEVVAQVEGVSITEDQVRQSVADELEQLEQERRRLLDGAVEEHIRQLLIDIAALRAGIEPEQLLAVEVEDKLAMIPATAVASVARERGLDLDDPEAERALRRELRLAAFVEELRHRSDVVRFLEAAG